MPSDQKQSFDPALAYHIDVATQNKLQHTPDQRYPMTSVDDLVKDAESVLKHH